MKEKLQELLKNSYAPYSNYHVASIVEMNDGSLFSGVNVENMVNGGSICAERNAINNAVANGYKKGDFKNIYLMNDKSQPDTPCFICRQTFEEFFNEDTKIIVVLSDREVIYSMNDLCPKPFDGVK